MKKISYAVCGFFVALFAVSAFAKGDHHTTQTTSASHTSEQPTCQLSRDEANIQRCTELAESGDAIAQNTLGEIFYGDNLLYQKGDHTKARLLFEKAAAQGLAKAQYNLGSMYRDELNNFPIALSWFEKAAAQGNADAQNSIGYIYENASGGKPPRPYIFDQNGKNLDKKIPDIKAKFAKLDNNLPVDYYRRSIYPLSEYGQGVEPNLQKAIEWYQKAANQGHALAQTNLAYFYLFGIGVDKDENHAFKLYEKAANQQFVPAIRTLAFMYMQGLGIKVDEHKAFTLLEQVYQLQPDETLWNFFYSVMYRHYGLKTKLEHKDQKTIRIRYYSIIEGSDEDFIYGSLYGLKNFYNLDMLNSSHLFILTKNRRNTFDVWSGKDTGDLLKLKERYFIKKSIQGYYNTMTLLSYFYKGEGNDLQKAMLWRKYALKMGQVNKPGFWPNYPPLEDNVTQ
jgi:TPR repeat protein